MNRRDFLKVPALAIITAPAVEAVAKLWPFEPIDWLYLPADFVPTDPDNWNEAWNAMQYRTCDLCDLNWIDLLLEYDREHQMYRTTDGAGLCVCERCTGDYLAEANQ
jgi:hypothetical protein